MPLPSHLETPRLLLRPPVFPDDAALIHVAYASDPEVARYDAWRAHADGGETLRYLWALLAARETGREHPWLLTARGTGEVLGMITLYTDGTDWRLRLGYSLARGHWGRGLMSEAVPGVVAAAFSSAKIRRVWAVVDQENHGSLRVLEKCGFTREGLLHRWSVHPALGAEPRACWCFAQVR